jgi:hypothetical protein
MLPIQLLPDASNTTLARCFQYNSCQILPIQLLPDTSNTTLARYFQYNSCQMLPIQLLPDTSNTTLARYFQYNSCQIHLIESRFLASYNLPRIATCQPTVRENQTGITYAVMHTGHGSQKRDFSGDEKDGMNETLCPTDFEVCSYTDFLAIITCACSNCGHNNCPVPVDGETR